MRVYGVCEAVIGLSVMLVCISGMMIPSNYHQKGATVWQKCKVACQNEPKSAGFCPCNLYHRQLYKRSSEPSNAGYDENGEDMDAEEFLDLLLQELLSIEKGKSSYYKADSYPALQNTLMELTKPKKRGIKGVSNGNPDNHAANMVRSKKRWLSLHDQFDSQDRGGDMVVPDLWKEDSSRKTFRYG